MILMLMIPLVSYFTLEEAQAGGSGDITKINVSIKMPMTGKNPDINPTSGDPDMYTVEVLQSGGNYYWETGGTMQDPDRFMRLDEPFVIGEKYFVTIDIKAVSGYEFHTNFNDIYVNGKSVGEAHRQGLAWLKSEDKNYIRIMLTYYGMTPAEAFVTRLYSICLNRDPDEAGFNDWVGKLTSGGRTGSQVASGFIFSKEFKNKNYCKTCYIKRLYRALFGREYDEGGLEFWYAKLKTGSTREAVFNGFINSIEFKNLCDEYNITPGAKIAVPEIEKTIMNGNCSDCGATPPVKYTITYVVNGGTLAANSRKWYTDESPDFSLKSPTRTGYTFGGWYKDAAKTQRVYKVFNGEIGNKTFYAKWTANKYSIKFNANGGSGTMTNQTGIKYGTTVTLKANTFTRSGYTFVGWNRKADGSGTSYANKASVKNLASTNGGLVTLYAQWKKK